MPPRLSLFGASRSLTIRSRSSIVHQKPAFLRVAARRGYADAKDFQPATGPNQDVLGHVSEEAADMSDVTGETKPDISQGTPVQEILERDQEGKDKAPQIIKEQMDKKKDVDSNAFAGDGGFANAMALGQLESFAAGGNGQFDTPGEFEEYDEELDSFQEEDPGHMFGLPTLPIPKTDMMKYRYHPVVDQVTKLIMTHGRLGLAQRNVSFILNHLRTQPPPNTNPARPLIPGTPSPSHLPLNPVLYLTTAIDSVAPLLRLKAMKGAAGGGASLQIPVPLGIRQRRRFAITWILDSVNKKTSRGSGRTMFAHKFADEIISVVEGRSAVWDKRLVVHKAGTSARVNLGTGRRKRRF